MLKSFILTPSDDITSYKYHKEYPFILFPKITFIYNNKHKVELDQKDLSLLFFFTNNKNSKNNYLFNCYFMKNPKKIILQKSEQYNIMKKYKFDSINDILPFTKDINNIVINYLYNENIKWKITKKRTYNKQNPFTIYKYLIKNETIPIMNIRYKNKHLQFIIYADFEENSYIPYNNKIIYIKNKNISHIPINSKNSRILYFVKELSITTDTSFIDSEESEIENEIEKYYNYTIV